MSYIWRQGTTIFSHCGRTVSGGWGLLLALSARAMACPRSTQLLLRAWRQRLHPSSGRLFSVMTDSRTLDSSCSGQSGVHRHRTNDLAGEDSRGYWKDFLRRRQYCSVGVDVLAESTPASRTCGKADENYSKPAAGEHPQVFLWGVNKMGQLGQGGPGILTQTVTRPTVSDFFGNASLSGVKLVRLGATHSSAILEDGSLYTWGEASRGKLGHKHVSTQPLR